MLQSTISIEAYKALSVAKHTRGQGSHLGNETKSSVPALKPIEISEMCRKHTSCLDPQIKVMAWLFLH